jgi:DNA replication protein DnaC
MKNPTEPLEHASVRQYCKAVRMPAIGANFVSLAEQAVKENQTHIRYLEALLQVESEERDRHAIASRIRDAQLPRMKTLEEFDFAQAPRIPAAKIRELAEGGYIERSEPVVLIGECGTGKSHLATGLCLEACRQKRRVRFITAAALVNELVEAKHNNQVRRLMARWQRYELIAVDEVGYVPLADVGAEFLFQGGRPCFPIRGCAKLSWTALRIGLISSRPERNRSAFAGRWKGGRNKREPLGGLTPRGRCGKRRSEFLRHGQIYQSDVVSKVRDEAHSGSAPVPSFR